MNRDGERVEDTDARGRVGVAEVETELETVVERMDESRIANEQIGHIVRAEFRRHGLERDLRPDAARIAQRDGDGRRG